MQKLKRNNWSNDEIVHLVNLMKVKANEASILYYESIESYNEAIDDIMSLFLEFEQPVTVWGAMSYGLEDKGIVHSGGVPEEYEEQFILERIDNTANILN